MWALKSENSCQASAPTAARMIALCSSLSPFPGLEVDHHLARGAGLVPARPIVELGHFVKACGHVVPRPDPLRPVDGPGLERREDLAHRQVDHGGTESAQHLAAEARHAELEPLIVVKRVDFLVEPAAHLDAGAGTQEPLDVERRGNLIPQLLATAIGDPGGVLGRREAEGYGGEEIEGGGLALTAAKEAYAWRTASIAGSFWRPGRTVGQA